MNYAEGIQPLTALRTRSTELIRSARETGQPVIITQNGKPTAVLLDIESYQRQRDALLFLKLVAQGEQDYQQGDVLSQSEADAHFRAKLEEIRSRG
jgi:prevent-host-death family protein